MREYALVVLDSQDKIIDRFNFDLVTNPVGNGFQLNLSTITSDLEDIITKVTQKKTPVTFVVQQIYNSYTKSNLLATWIQKYSTTDYTMALEYNDGKRILYVDGKVTALEKTENTYNDVMQQALTFTTITPKYIKRENVITIEEMAIGKRYPYKYPYMYGSNVVENNEIYNPYILDVPLIITIDGGITNPIITLTDFTYDSGGNKVLGSVYNTVAFNIDLQSNMEIVINSAQRKILLNVYEDETREVLVSSTDYSGNTLPQYDTFLRAKNGYSQIGVNSESTDNFKLTGTWRQYTL